VFLPESLLPGIAADSSRNEPAGTASTTGTPTGKGKGKSKATGRPSSKSGPIPTPSSLPKLSQKSLFLALYAKVISGEKKKDEEAGYVMGPQDVGTITNKQLLLVSRYLDAWFEERSMGDDDAVGSQGWLEYL